MHCVDLGESFQIDPNSNAYFVAKFGFDTTVSEPCKVCPLSAYRSPRSAPPTIVQPTWDHSAPASKENEVKPPFIRNFFEDETRPQFRELNSWIPPKKLRQEDHRKTRVEAKFDFTVAEDSHFEIVSDYSDDEGDQMKWSPPADGPAADAILHALAERKKEERRKKLERREQMVMKMSPGAREIFRFREFVIRKYGNLVCVCGILCDPHKSASVTRKEFP